MWLNRVLLVVGVLAAMLLLSFAVEALRNPVILLLGGGVTLLLTTVDDRRTAVRMAVPTAVFCGLLGWAATQRSYLDL